MDGTILIADDDRTIRTVLTQAFTRAGCRVRSTGSVSTLWRWVEEGEGDVVVSDVMMPDGNGLELMPMIRKKRPELPVVIISAQNSVMTAIRASEVGAYDYLPKPFDLKELLAKVGRALLRSEADTPVQEEGVTQSEISLIGSSPAMQEIYRLVARVLNTDLNVMISGPAGSGKTLLAETLHKQGHRSGNPLVSISAGSATPKFLRETLLSTEDTPDFDLAPKGSTVLIEEVSDASPEAQSTLLGLLQNPTVTGRGYRFISTTSKPLVDLVNEGQFREDLFFRLNVMPIVLPPLRDRIDDIAELTMHFLEKAPQRGLPKRSVTRDGLDVLRAAHWSGNVRELENLINRAVLLASDDQLTGEFMETIVPQSPSPVATGTIVPGDKLSASVEAHIKRYFDLHGDALPPPGLYNRILKEVELPLIALSLSATRGNQIKTAELLGINRNTLRKKIRDLDIQVTRSKKLM
ncbi:MAG: response regulator [Pseudomonadota bacterium]